MNPEKNGLESQKLGQNTDCFRLEALERRPNPEVFLHLQTRKTDLIKAGQLDPIILSKVKPEIPLNTVKSATKSPEKVTRKKAKLQ